MVSKEKLYEAFGELIYAVAKADGLVQDEEITALNEILQRHPWSKEAKWSFDYEKSKDSTLEQAYDKAVDIFKEFGPSPEYMLLLEVLEEVAKASEGINTAEKDVIDGFQKDLKARFIKDIEAGKLNA